MDSQSQGLGSPEQRVPPNRGTPPSLVKRSSRDRSSPSSSVEAVPTSDVSIEAMQMNCSATESFFLDAPQPWLLKLISGQYLDSASKLSLFQTCRQLNGMVMQHSQSTLSLDLLITPLDAAHQALQCVCSQTKLRLHHGLRNKYMEYDENTRKCKQLGHIICSFLQEAAKRGTTATVAALQLEGAWLPAIVLPEIGQTCPDIAKLVLRDLRIDTDTIPNACMGFQRLQCLEIRDVRFVGLKDKHQLPPVPDDTGSDSGMHEADDMHDRVPNRHEALQAHLGSLPALTSLTLHCELHGCDCAHQGVMGVNDVSIVNALADQLTHLCLETHGSYSAGEALARLNWVKLGSALQHLQLCSAEMCDHDIKLLLQLPMLTHIEVLQILMHESLVGEPCKWQELTCYATSVKALACLPLHADMLLKVGRSEVATLYLDDSNPELIQQAMTNTRNCRGVIWAEQGVRVSAQDNDDYEVDEVDPDTLAEWLVYALPLVKDIRSLVVTEGFLDGNIMPALCEWACDRLDQPCLHLGRGLLANHLYHQHHHCDEHAEQFELTVLGESISILARSMPLNSTLKLSLPYGVACCVELVTELCCAAQHQLTLHVKCDLPVPDGCMDCVKSAVQSRGHELTGVSVDVNEHHRCYTLRVTVEPCHA